MRYAKDHAAETRERIVETAGRLFRERGIDAVGVAELMKAAELTHGGFYAHFASKEALAEEACARALEATTARFEEVAGEKGLDAWIEGYLSPRHRREPAAGCPMAALGTEAGRRGARFRAAFSAGIEKFFAALAARLPGTVAARRRRAIATFASLLGALVLARAADDRLGAEILDTVRKDVLGR